MYLEPGRYCDTVLNIVQPHSWKNVFSATVCHQGPRVCICLIWSEIDRIKTGNAVPEFISLMGFQKKSSEVFDAWVSATLVCVHSEDSTLCRRWNALSLNFHSFSRLIRLTQQTILLWQRILQLILWNKALHRHLSCANAESLPYHAPPCIAITLLPTNLSHVPVHQLFLFVC